MLQEWVPAVLQGEEMQHFEFLSDDVRVSRRHILTHLNPRKQITGVRSLLLFSDPSAVKWEQQCVSGLRLALQRDILSVRPPPRVCFLTLTHSTTSRSSQMRDAAAAAGTEPVTRLPDSPSYWVQSCFWIRCFFMDVTFT